MPTVLELKQECRKKGISGYSTLKKDALMKVLGKSPSVGRKSVGRKYLKNRVRKSVGRKSVGRKYLKNRVLKSGTCFLYKVKAFLQMPEGEEREGTPYKKVLPKNLTQPMIDFIIKDFYRDFEHHMVDSNGRMTYDGDLKITFSKTDHLFHILLCGDNVRFPVDWDGKIFTYSDSAYYEGMMIKSINTSLPKSDWAYKGFQTAIKENKY